MAAINVGGLMEGNVIRARGAGMVLVPGERQGAYRQIGRHNAIVVAEPVSPSFEAGSVLDTLPASIVLPSPWWLYSLR